MTDSQAEAWGDNTERRRARCAGDEARSNNILSWLQPGKQTTELGAKICDWSTQKHQVRCVGPFHLHWKGIQIAFTKERTLWVFDEQA